MICRNHYSITGAIGSLSDIQYIGLDLRELQTGDFRCIRYRECVQKTPVRPQNADKSVAGVVRELVVGHIDESVLGDRNGRGSESGGELVKHTDVVHAWWVLGDSQYPV